MACSLVVPDVVGVRATSTTAAAGSKVAFGSHKASYGN